ncbi:MAG: AAA family ATPase [Lacipirellulaceae bacterium]
MKLTEVYVDGFGVWRDLRLRKLSSDVTVFYGPNEAGKTTLLHFLRAMLYGVTPDRRERYLPPRGGGRPGGGLGLDGDDGPFQVSRYVDRGDDDRGRVVVTLPDGEEQGDRLLRESLEAIDERTFSNVFAIGLDEINELGALEGAEAARWIYRLTSGLDRVSLYDVIQGLRSSRKRLLAAAGEPSVLGDLHAQRERLETEIGELVAGGRRWAKLSIELEECDAQQTQLEADLKEAERRARRIEVALGLKPLWADRVRIEGDRLKYAGLAPLPTNAIESLDGLNAKSLEHQQQREVVRGQRKQLHEEIRELGLNEALVRSGCRLDALGEQQDWLESLDRQAKEHAAEADKLGVRIDAEAGRLAKLWRHKPTAETAPAMTEDMLDRLRPAAEAASYAEQLVTEAKRDLDARRGDERQYTAQMETALTSSERLGLPNDIEKAGDLVAQLRRRLKAEQKLEQARRAAMDLEQQNRDLVDQQVMPIEWVLVLTTGFIICCVTAAWPLISGEQFGGWQLGGILGALGLFAARFFIEDNAADLLDGAEQQLDLVDRQIAEARREQQTLDEDLPLKEGSAVIRLQNAERHLAELERVLPVEAERRRANQHAKGAEELYTSAKEDLAKAEKDWKIALRAAGLPEETTAIEVERFAAQHRALDADRERLAELRAEATTARAEHDKVAKRITALAEEAGMPLKGKTPLEQLTHLLTERRLQQNRIDHRKKLRERARDLKDKSLKLGKLAERVEQERQGMFRAAGVENEQGYRQRAADLADLARLDEKHERLSREIAAAIGKSGAETDYVALLAPDSIHKLDAQFDALTAEHGAIERRLREVVARRGALDAERSAMVADTSLADRKLELGVVEAQTADARERWRERATVGTMLDLIRNDYEQHRQPETLLEASKVLEKLTRGRYPRVWTPLADDVLLVDDADGVSLPVENLSRGTREQLFLSVRLALVAMYARRGVQLPMVLDDVLVNFDDRRAAVAAQVLTDFAKEGHQLLVFTCHEHVWELFKELRVDVRRLPARFDEPADEPADEVVEEDIVEEDVIDEAPAEEPVVEEAAIDEPEVVADEPRRARKPKRRKKRPVVVVDVQPTPPRVEAVYGALEPARVVVPAAREPKPSAPVERVVVAEPQPRLLEVEYGAPAPPARTEARYAYTPYSISPAVALEPPRYELPRYEPAPYEPAPYDGFAYGVTPYDGVEHAAIASERRDDYRDGYGVADDAELARYYDFEGGDFEANGFAAPRGFEAPVEERGYEPVGAARPRAAAEEGVADAPYGTATWLEEAEQAWRR